MRRHLLPEIRAVEHRSSVLLVQLVDVHIVSPILAVGVLANMPKFVPSNVTDDFELTTATSIIHF